MGKMRPFKGLLYNAEKIGGDFSGVVAPPYDVIPDRMRDELYEKSPYNVIRLILGKTSDSDNDEDNRYTRAAKFFKEWQEEGVLSRNGNEAFYVYLQEYDFEGKSFSRIGFFGLLKIEDSEDEKVIPHEHTLAKPKEDRLNLIKQVKSNLSPIFTLFPDTDGSVTEVLKNKAKAEPPIIDIEREDGKHKLWRVADKESIEKISKSMENKSVYIADGHHRYAVSKTYRDMRRSEPNYDGSADYVMVYFTDMESGDNLAVMATHRAVKEMPLSGDKEVISKLADYFATDEFDTLSELTQRLYESREDSHIFGYYGGEKFISFKLKDENALQDLINDDRSLSWKQLDVSILHSGIFRKLLSVKDGEGNLTYVKKAEEAEELVRDKSHKAAFFLNPTKVSQLRAVTEHGEMMPQKSTYFYPKLLTGLVINKFD